MSLDFGKLDFSISFNPTSAFPLDARSYFESYEAAQQAASSAEEAGSFNSVYYYGQTVVVVDKNIASLYIIQPNKTLGPVQGSVLINADIFTYDSEGKLTLNNFASADENTVLLKNDKGEVVWAPYYNTYNKDEIDNKINEAVQNVSHLKRKIVSSIAEIEIYMTNHNDAGQYIFMIPISTVLNLDRYDEYIVVEAEDSTGITVQYIERFGAYDVDLSDYATLDYVINSLNSKVDKSDSARLITYTEAEKLLNIEPFAQVNIIDNISSNFSIGENKTLHLNNISISQVDNLETLLNNKVEKIEGYTLLSPSDQQKLDSLIIGSQGNLEISGNINVDKVIGLEEWINEHANDTIGLSKHNLTDSLYDKLVGDLLIESVETSEFNLLNNHLSINKIEHTKVNGLEELLNSKTDISVTNNLKTSINIIEESIKNYVTKETHEVDIGKIHDILTWKEI